MCPSLVAADVSVEGRDPPVSSEALVPSSGPAVAEVPSDAVAPSDREDAWDTADCMLLICESASADGRGSGSPLPDSSSSAPDGGADGAVTKPDEGGTDAIS